MNQTVLIWMLFGFLGLACLALLRSAILLKTDLNRIAIGLRALVRNSPAAGVRFSSQMAQHIWHSALTLASRSRNYDSTRSAYDEMIQLGHSISSNVDQAEATASAAVQLLMRQAAPEVCAVAIFGKDPQDGTLRLKNASGVPVGRLQEVLLSWMEKLFDGSGGTSWGYHLPERGGAADFSVFGIGYSFTTPLSEDGQMCGAIWLGFRQGALGLTPEKRLFIQAICDHCAASFHAASRVQRNMEEKNREKDFLLGLSHDLRSPGNSALYALRDLLSDETAQLNVDQRFRLKIVEDCLEEQLDILGDVLDYTKHRRGILAANRVSCTLRSLVEFLFEKHRLHADQKHLELCLDSIPDVRILVDVRHARRVLGNLIGNAIKYTEHGSVHVSFSCSADSVSVIVRDTGIGVPEKERALLFQEFSRLTNASHLPGVGLGLAVCNVLMGLNGGTLGYRAIPSGGSIFEATFVRASSTAENVALKEIEESAPALECILIVDDDPAACRSISRCLQPLARNIISAQSTAEAIIMINERKPDLLITDYYLGDMTADELLQNAALKEQALPTIVLSGSSTLPLSSNRILADFPVCFAEKPLEQTELLEIIYRVFNSQRGTQESCLISK